MEARAHHAECSDAAAHPHNQQPFKISVHWCLLVVWFFLEGRGSECIGLN
jgi:hypothetical protein